KRSFAGRAGRVKNQWHTVDNRPAGETIPLSVCVSRCPGGVFMRRLSPLALLPALFILLPLTAADPPKAAPERGAAEPKRAAYVAKRADARALAAVLAKQFKGAAEIQAGPDGSGNVLLISAPPAVFDEVMKIVELLDRKPQSVAVEVWLVEVAARKADDK